MLVRIDGESARQFGLVNVSDAHGDVRRYYAADAPHLMIVVTHGGLMLGDLAGRVVDATIGWHDGLFGFVRPGNEDKRHSKMTIYRVVEKSKGTPKTARLSLPKSLAQVLQAAPKEGANVSASEA